MILNPALLYTFFWSFLLFLYNLRLSNVLLPLSRAALFYFLATICMFLLGNILFSLVSRKLIVCPKFRLEVYREWVFSPHTTKMLSTLTKILLVGLSAEIVYFQNLPLISLFGVGRTVLYTDFGFPGIHGLFNAILLVILSILFVRQLFKPTRLNLMLIILAFAWPVLLVTRQLFVTIAVEFVFLYILVRGVSFKRFAKVFMLVCGLVFMFGYIGDMRSGRDSFIALARPTFEYPDFLPSGLLWVYIYMVSPLNNVVNNMDIAPYYAPIGTISGLIPSFARSFLMDLLGVTPPEWRLVNETLNVSSMHEKYLTDFGPYLSNFFYFLVSFFSCFLAKRSSRDPRYGFALVVVLHSIVFSFFADFLFHLVFVAQLVFYIVLFKRPRLNA